MTTLDEERTIRTALEILVREKDEQIARLEQALSDLSDRTEYRGYSVSWIYSKAELYGRSLDHAWDALRSAGIKCDGTQTVAEGIKLLADRPIAP